MTAYGDGQLKVLLPHLPHPPRWLFLGGPADANEAQTARRLWPGIPVVGVEPNPEAVAWQRANGWPSDAPLLHAALTDRHGGTVEVTYEPGRLRNARRSDSPDQYVPASASRRITVPAVSIDGLTDLLEPTLGPVEDALLWLDIEGSELLALRGAGRLLGGGRVMSINVELMDTIPGVTSGVHQLLTAAGYIAVCEWNASAACRDRVYVRGAATRPPPVEGTV